jgi:hypothetical protein
MLQRKKHTQPKKKKEHTAKNEHIEGKNIYNDTKLKWKSRVSNTCNSIQMDCLMTLHQKQA